MIFVDYFLMSKHQPLDENVLFSSKLLYELLQEKKHVDELFFEYAKARKIVLSLNVEKALYLALTFLYSVGKIRYKNNFITRV